MVRTPGFHPGNRGSIPLRATNLKSTFIGAFLFFKNFLALNFTSPFTHVLSAKTKDKYLKLLNPRKLKINLQRKFSFYKPLYFPPALQPRMTQKQNKLQVLPKLVLFYILFLFFNNKNLSF